MSVAQLALAGAFIIPRAAACASFRDEAVIPDDLAQLRQSHPATVREHRCDRADAAAHASATIVGGPKLRAVVMALRAARSPSNRPSGRTAIRYHHCVTGIEHMPIQLDPEEHEITALVALLPNLHQSRVVEVGCGDGRLTRRYAARAASVLAFDPDEVSIAAVRSNSLDGDVELRTATVESVDIPEGSADVVLLSWAL